MKSFLAALAALWVLVLAPRAEASHFRYGNITYKIPDPVGSPLTVRFDVVTAWRSDYGSANTSNPLYFGDGTTNPATDGTIIGSGTDASGSKYNVHRYTVTHTYPAPGLYTATWGDCCRISKLSNAADDYFQVTAKVDLTSASGNTGNPVSVVPAIIQLQTNGVRTIQIPAVDPDGTPITCRFATKSEAGMTDPDSVLPPVIPGVNGKAPTLEVSSSPPGCTLIWDTTGAVAKQQFAIQVVLESKNKNNANVGSAVLDFIVEMVAAPVPGCSGTKAVVLDMGQTLSTDFIGTNNAGGNTLTMSAIGSIGVLNPISGASGASPFKTTLTWSPGVGEEGTGVIAVIFTDQLNTSGFCTLTVTVPECDDYGKACTAGLGQCQANGKLQCVGQNVECTAKPKMPMPEICNGIDDDCNGTSDDNIVDLGDACMTGLPSICSTGTKGCVAGVAKCDPDILPGTQSETCNAVDDNCDGKIDDGFNVGGVCGVGVGQCEEAGVLVCDGSGGVVCDVVPDGPQPESCNGLDDDCDGTPDDGLGLGLPCTLGLGECAKSGTSICDTNGGVTCDAVAGTPVLEVCDNNLDDDCEGTVNNGCNDTDGDGVQDGLEEHLGMDPNDADSDDDGVLDGEEPSFDQDTDGDGLVNAFDPDSDDDGLFDGTELGLGCDKAATNAQLGHCKPDGDGGATKTDPLNADTDGGGKTDGSEDPNLNGISDGNEGNATSSADDGTIKDFDGDGLSDVLEESLGSNPKDADSDDDGLLDGDERNPSDDTDRDGIINVLDTDSDNDALFDGTESGKNCKHPATDAAKGNCRLDADAGATKTSPVNADTDLGGVTDGAEDANLNGAIGGDDFDPNDKADDTKVIDSDGDGLSDGLEGTLSSNADDADSDDDGLLDGEEPNPTSDVDGDGTGALNDPDADNDGLYDGTEVGKACNDPSTSEAKGQCKADGDNGKTKTYVLLADSDGGSVKDGEEDADADGVVDSGERDPNVAGDDVAKPECTRDAECGTGKLCDAEKCVAGCRGEGGNGCPEGQVCTSTDATAGVCEAASTTGDTPRDTGGGCGCRTAPVEGDGYLFGMGLIAALAGALRRRKR
jgi:MYXO-CTERM domain-containing protein